MHHWTDLKKNSRGVTLYEILAVIMIVGILAGVTFVTYERQAQKNQRTEAVNFLHSLLDGARLYDMQHPQQLTGERTNSDWIANWKTYLSQYATRQLDHSYPGSPILITGSGNKLVSYFFDEVNSQLRIYASYSNAPVYDFITWNGEVNEEPGAGVACTADSECFRNFCENYACSNEGECIYSPIICNDGNECTADSCENSTGCIFDPGPNNGETCDDGNQCTDDGTCQNGTCEPGNNLPNGTLCDDDNLCTLNDQCTNGTCRGIQRQCFGGFSMGICNTMSCNPDTGNCEFPPDGTPCNDGDPCTEPDLCDGNGQCVGRGHICEG